MVEPKVSLIVKVSTKDRFQSILKEFKKLQPDYRVSQDFVLRKLMDKYEGDLQ